MPAQTRSGAKASLSKNSEEVASLDTEKVYHHQNTNPSPDLFPSSDERPEIQPDPSAPDSPPPKSKPILAETPLSVNESNLSPRAKLLDLRKRYKKAASLFHQAKHHYDMLSECRNDATIPNGLRIKTNCQAAAKHLTSITSYWDEILSNTERDLLGALLTHYKHVCTVAAEKTKEILCLIAETLNSADGQTISDHTTIMKITELNLTKRRTNFDKKKKKRTNSKFINKTNNNKQPEDPTDEALPLPRPSVTQRRSARTTPTHQEAATKLHPARITTLTSQGER